MRNLTLVALATLLAAAPSWAEEPEPSEDDDKTEEAPRPAILDAIELPMAAERARKAGIPEDQVEAALGAVKEKGEKGHQAQEARRVLDEAGAAAEEHGPTDNFGAFVQARLAEGKRGRDLAEAIRAEHQAHGKGKPEHAGQGGDGEHGKAGEHGKSGEQGKAGEHGKSGEQGKAGGQGKSGDQGQGAGAGKGDGSGKPQGGGRSGTAAKPAISPAPDTTGKPETAGRPETAGKPTTPGKPAPKSNRSSTSGQ